MAKVKITGHASGTGILTVTAPNTSTDRTITLPDATGTLAITTDDDDKLPLAGGTLTGALVGTTASFSTADNTDTLTLISTDADATAAPNLRMYRNSASPADGDVASQIDFEGRNDNSQDVVYGTIKSVIQDASDGTEDGKTELTTIVAGSDVRRMSLSSSETVFNEDSIDLDFRVESDNNTDALFVQGSDGNVGIGTGSPSTHLHVKGNTVNTLTLECSLTNGSSPGLDFADLYSSGAIRGRIATMVPGDGATGEMRFYTRQSSSLTEILKLTTDGRVVSQSNAHSWINYDQSGTIVIRDSYNVSSITDAGTGYAKIYFNVDHGQSYYAVSGMAGNHKRMTQDGAGLNSEYVAIYTQTHSGTSTADESRCFVITFGD
jgi:hypothetical protein